MSPSLRWPERSVDTCMMDFPTDVPDSTNTLGLVMFHEVFHVLGAVDLRAPDGDGGYHIGNNASDLMGGSQGTVQLDPNRRNYWAHGRNDLSDVSTSSFMSTEASLLNSARDDLPQLWRVRIGENFDPFYEPGDSVSPSQSGGISSGYSSDTAVSTICNESGGSTAVTFTGRLSGGDVADQPVAVIWVTETNGRCIAASTLSSGAGEFTLELPEEAHRRAAFQLGGGYCVVWDANGDGVFDSAGEPLDCTSDLAVGRTINWTLRR